MSFLNNPWVVGIGGGILSGIIVTFISRFLLSRRDAREYAQKVSGANREIIYAVRPGVSEGMVPSRAMLVAIVEATARKFGVDKKDMLRPHEVAQELIKEVMDSSFISAKTKQDYCDSLAELSVPESEADAGLQPATRTVSLERRDLERYRARMVTSLSAAMGIMVAFMTLVMTIYSTRDGQNLAFWLFGVIPDEPGYLDWGDSRTTFNGLVVALLGVAASLVAVFALVAGREFLEKSESRPRKPSRVEPDRKKAAGDSPKEVSGRRELTEKRAD